MRITSETSLEEIKNATKKVINMPNFPNMKIVYVEGKHNSETNISFQHFLRRVCHDNTRDNNTTND